MIDVDKFAQGPTVESTEKDYYELAALCGGEDKLIWLFEEATKALLTDSPLSALYIGRELAEEFKFAVSGGFLLGYQFAKLAQED